MTTRWTRFARGWITAGFATFVAAFLHVASSGHAPSSLALALSLAFSGMICIALTGKRLALWRRSVSVAVSQFLFHALFWGLCQSARLRVGSFSSQLTRIPAQMSVRMLTPAATHLVTFHELEVVVGILRRRPPVVA